MLFRDRKDAGRQLAERLAFLKNEKDVVVLGIPRGGVVVAAEVARVLGAPLDVFIAHKIGAPSNPEFAIGALTSTGEVLLDDQVVKWLNLSAKDLALEIDCQQLEIKRRLDCFRKGRTPLGVQDRVVVLVDDGVATGSTMRVALAALRKSKPRRLVLAVPVGPTEIIRQLEQECDQVVVVYTPEPFWSVGRFYTYFEQTLDAEVIALLEAD